jgi:hypothetical protein
MHYHTTNIHCLYMYIHMYMYIHYEASTST